MDLATYLDDHLAGSTGALELLDNLIDTHAGKPLHAFLKQLRDDIEADQTKLKQLISDLGIEESSIRKAGAWVAEKLSRAKLRSGDNDRPNLALLQSLESLSIGIAGKRSLWRVLRRLADSSARLPRLDFEDLEKRAIHQYERVQNEVANVGKQIFLAELDKPGR